MTSVWLKSGCCALVTACSGAQVVAARITALQAQLSLALLTRLLPFPFAWLQSLELSGGLPAADFSSALLLSAWIAYSPSAEKQLQGGCLALLKSVGVLSLPCWQRSCCFKRFTADSIDEFSK